MGDSAAFGGSGFDLGFDAPTLVSAFFFAAGGIDVCCSLDDGNAVAAATGTLGAADCGEFLAVGVEVVAPALLTPCTLPRVMNQITRPPAAKLSKATGRTILNTTDLVSCRGAATCTGGGADVFGTSRRVVASAFVE